MAGLQDLSSLTRDLTHTLGSESRGPNHWTAREFPVFVFIFFQLYGGESESVRCSVVSDSL